MDMFCVGFVNGLYLEAKSITREHKHGPGQTDLWRLVKQSIITCAAAGQPSAKIISGNCSELVLLDVLDELGSCGLHDMSARVTDQNGKNHTYEALTEKYKDLIKRAVPRDDWPVGRVRAEIVVRWARDD